MCLEDRFFVSLTVAIPERGGGGELITGNPWAFHNLIRLQIPPPPPPLQRPVECKNDFKTCELV